MAKTKGVYKRGEVWWIHYTGPDGKKRFETTRSSSMKDPEACLMLQEEGYRIAKLALGDAAHRSDPHRTEEA